MAYLGAIFITPSEWASAQQDKPQALKSAVYPSKEFLEFLAEFDETDDETFELVMHHGKRDAELQELENLKDSKEIDSASVQDAEVKR